MTQELNFAEGDSYLTNLGEHITITEIEERGEEKYLISNLNSWDHNGILKHGFDVQGNLQNRTNGKWQGEAS